MIKNFAFLAACLTTLVLQAEPITAKSPDGKLEVTINDRFGGASYSVKYDGATALRPSALGLITNENNLSNGLKIKDSKADHISQDYSLTRSKQSQVHYEANPCSVPCRTRPASSCR